jgi:hypothetical protein
MMESDSQKSNNEGTTVYPVVVTAEPIQAQISSVHPNPSRLTNRGIEVYNLSKSVRIFTMIDGLFCLIYTAYNIYYLIPFLMVLFGFYGAKTYNKNYTLIYLIYSILNLISKIVVWSVFIYYSSSDESNYDYGGFTLFSWLSILIELYILRIVNRYYTGLKKLTEQELIAVKDLKYRVARIIYW